MKLSPKQAKLLFRHAQRRFKVTNDFIDRNMTAMMKFVQYAITPRIVLKRKLIRKRNRVFLRHNYLRKLIFDPTKLKKRRHDKRLHSQWSKRLVLHLRRHSLIEYVEEEETTKEEMNKKDVSKQLKEQLELLKSGKRIVPLLEDPHNSKPTYTIKNSIRLSSIDIIRKDEDTVRITTLDENDLEENHLNPIVPLLSAVHITDEEFKASADITDIQNNRSFLDMLISKVKHKTCEGGETETSLSLEKSMVPPNMCNNKAYEKEGTETEERENSNSSSDFFGFEDNERMLVNFPGMLSTPLVRHRDSNAAFVSETLNAYMRDNSLGNSVSINYIQRRPEDGKVLSNSVPPKLDFPALPDGLQGLRTVAERRSFLQRTKNMKYCIINNVATVFRELQKRTKGHRIYKQAIESVMTSTSVPMTRQGWKAAAWLLTDIGNYCCQTIAVNGKNFRLCGGLGNFRTKYRKPHSNFCDKIISVCPKNCIDRTTFRSFRPIRTPEKRSKLNDSSKKVLHKPCPLSQKILKHPRDEESVFDSLSIVRMPEVELEVFPQLHKPLSEVAKKYLQLILPYKEISRKWAEFSVSTLIESRNIDFAANPQKSFTFKLPFANDRNHLIIRRIYNRSEEFDSQFDSSSFLFRKEVDQNNVNGKPPDFLTIECADILTDMLNSVAIACSENLFIKDDPDNIDQYKIEDMVEEKSATKTDQHQQQTGMSNKKQSRLLMELKRLNATVIDAATSKAEEDGTICAKECCKLGCVCASLSERTTVRQHCGKQKCVLECKCKCQSIVRLETDGRTITTEDAFMLRKQATARLARVEKEFTSTVVLTGSETLLINESQYDKKRRCTKIPKRYGDFVDHDDPDIVDFKSSGKRTEIISTSNVLLEPVLVNDKIYNRLKHSSVKLKRLHDIKDLAPWCMVHMLYKCFCKGQSTFGNPIIIEKQEEIAEVTSIEESVLKDRTLYSFEKEERKRDIDTYTSDESENSETSEASETVSDFNFGTEEKNKNERRGRISDNHYIEVYMNAKASHCRRVVPIPKNIYKRRNKKRIAHIQLYIAENESDETRLSLNEHILRSVYYHKDINAIDQKTVPELKIEGTERSQDINKKSRARRRKDTKPNVTHQAENESSIPMKKRRVSIGQSEERSSLLLVNHYKGSLKQEDPCLKNSTPLKSPKEVLTTTSPKFIQAPLEQITVPKITQIFSLNTGNVESPVPVPQPEEGSSIDIAQAPSDDMALTHGVSSDAFKNVFKQVIKNMNNLVSKKMQDIDMALRRESKAIPAPNAEILCIIRWNNFLEAYLEGFVYLWEVQTASLTFIAATIKPIMPLVMNALSVVNIQTIPKNKLPLLGKMLNEKKRSANSEGLAVVMQGQKMYWIVKGFLRPDKTRICPKPTPETHPLLTRKINVLCRLLINNQFNEHKKRQDALQLCALSNSSPNSANSANNITDPPIDNTVSMHSDSNTSFQPKTPSSPFCHPAHPAHPDQNTISLKLKVLPMQRNISDQATTILEQMVSQAYGFVRTNISFRKILSSELFEIFPPAKLNSNHHWLVLDISNDFSHIFIPELKDLLTLDRIQKVMAYALAKNRIVKMQFSQKSLFNAYVTPKSRRKLYFGPYRQSVTAPKLVLLQSVDGQMMLREVYESRHHIIPKSFSTTAFWVVQKCGKIFLDVEEDQLVQVQVNEPYLKDANDHSFSNNSNIQKICRDGVKLIEEHLTELNPPFQQSIQVQQEPQILESEQDLQYSKVQQDSQIEQSSKDHPTVVLSNVVTSTNLETQQNLIDDVQTFADTENKNSKTLNNTNYLDDDDDDCVIVDNKASAPLIVAPPVPSAPNVLGGKPESNPVSSIDFPKTNSNKINYTISYGGENSSLMVIQNECDRDPIVMSDAVSNSFTILSTDSQPSIIELPENQNLNLQKKVQQPLPINTIFDLSSEDYIPMNLKATNDVNPDEVILKIPKNDANTVLSVSPDHLGSISSSPNNNKPNDSSTFKQNNFILHTEREKGTTEICSNITKINEVSMKLNKNITITKLTPDVEQNPSEPLTYLRKSLPIGFQKPAPITLSSGSRFVTPLQKQNTTIPSASQMDQSRKKTIVPQNASQALRLQKTPATFRQIEQRHIVDQILGNNQQTLVRGKGGLVVRTPSTLNTIISAGNSPLITPELNSVSSGARLRAPATIRQIVRMPARVSLNNHPSTTSPHQILRQNLPDSLQSQQKKIFKRGPNQIPTKQILTSVKSSSTDISLQPQYDPLHISDRSTKIATNIIAQSKVLNGIKTVLDTAKQNTTQGHTVSSSTGAVGIKSTGTPVSRAQFRVQPIQKMPAEIVSSTIRRDSSADKKTSQVKGIPIDLPRLKKFAIVSSPTQNTTIITPPQAETNYNNDAGASRSCSIRNPNAFGRDIPEKVMSSGINTNFNLQATDKGTMSLTATKASSAGSSNASAEYGYFHANIEGLPKFVVKRVGEDFLIKVPNFNGILKLAGLSTVYNYLNQYTTQKCGKTNEEIANLKWTFKIQDRSKLNIINKSNSLNLNLKPGNNNLNMQNIFELKKSSNGNTTSSSTSPAPITKKMKLHNASTNGLEFEDSIDLSDNV
ncbi:uncharacterized protein LOC129906641 isoform X2 [Episyrphus balteatus]|uniref:uncharacterized protein LOC129906641 isoform X2 n=1 Tax=Episyrphus balteatus TaxID=286459 RepID=UPI0024852C62|nr:uncharacterized protein LOC129906641 isoform X2 [Episyrphus balteatus]